MWVTEHASKLLLAEVGITVPPGTACPCADAAHEAPRLGFPVYVKALVPIKDRATAGGVHRVRNEEELRTAIGKCQALGASEVRLEAEVTGSSSWYVAMGWFPPDERPHALLSVEGGTGIEARRHTIRRVAIDPEIGPLPHNVRALTRSAPLDRNVEIALLDVLRACFTLLWTKDAMLIELNPVELDGRTLIAVDARIIIDSASRIPKEDPRLAAVHDGLRETLAADLVGKGIVYVPLGGAVGVAGLGAGMTMHLADWVGLEGAGPAFFFDATEAAVRDWRAMFAGELPTAFAEALRYGLRRALPPARSLLVNFTSGGTPVDALVRGLLHAWNEGVEWNGPLVVHAAGNRGAVARKLLAEAGVDAPPTLADAVRRAVKLARPAPRPTQ